MLDPSNKTLVTGFVIAFAVLAPQATAQTVPAPLMKWGAFGTGAGQLSSPQDVAVNSAGEVFVAEVQNHRIQKFNSSGVSMATWGSLGTGNGQFNNPFGIAIAPDGSVYVADQNNHRIQKFDSQGNFLLKWGTNGTANGQFSFPRRIAVDASGNVYVTEFANRVQKFTSSGVFLTKWGSSGTGNGQFDVPFGIAVDGTGNVFVCDLENHRIQKFTSNGVFLTKWGSLGSTKGKFNLPRGVFTDAAGNVYVVDTENHRVQRFTNSGGYTLQWGSFGTGAGELNAPAGGTIDADGNVYIAERLNHRIQKFGEAPLPLAVASCLGVEFYAGFPARPGAIDFDAQDELYVGNLDVAGQDADPVPIWRVSSLDQSVATYGPPIPDPDVLIVDKTGTVASAGSVIVGGSIAACTSGCTGRLMSISPPATTTTVLFQGGCLGNVTGLAFDASGRLHVANYDSGSICRIEAGTLSGLVAPTGGQMGNIAFDTHGNFYVGWDDLVRKFDANGNLLDPSFVAGGLVGLGPPGPFAGLLIKRGDNLIAVDPVSKSERVLLEGTTASYSAFDSHGDLFLCETGNYRVLRIQRDSVPPSITAPPHVFAEAGTACSAYLSETQLGTPVAFDNCSDVAITRSAIPAGNSFPLGMTTVSYTAADAAGNTATAIQTITVVDTTPPTLSVPEDITRLTDPGSCTASVVFQPVAHDNCTEPQITCSPASGSTFSLGTTEVTCTATDESGNATSATFTVAVQNPAPTVTITGPASGTIFAVNTPVEFTGAFEDNAGDTHTAEWAFDLVPALDPSTVDETARVVSLTHSFTVAGVYRVRLAVRDQCDNTGLADRIGEFEALVVVYDPAAGFVTGGGWIQSPMGAYAPDPSISGKANFGFVSRYHRGATVPSGQTEFMFKLANLDFRSSVYEWLVVAGARAQYKGSGTINKAGDYGFILTALDGQENGGGGVDKLRMKIWDRMAGTVVYDSQRNEGDDESPSIALGGGSIVIHKSAVTKPIAAGSEIPTRYALRKNFPEPFNPTTTIEFDLPEPTVITLSIYDIRGKVVARLADRRSYVAGRHRILWDGSDVSSGVYFYRLESAQYMSTERMVLLK